MKLSNENEMVLKSAGCPNEKATSFRDVDKSRVAGSLPGCESTFTQLIKLGGKLTFIVSCGNN